MDEAFTRFPVLETPRLRLRELRMDDAPALLALFGDEDVVRYYDLPRFETLADAERQVRDRHAEYHAGKQLRWGITVPAEGDTVVGTVGLHGVERTHRFAELGYATLRARWNEGLATEAVERVVRFGFKDLGLRRVEAFVDPRNPASARLLVKLGFEREGRLRQRYWDGGAFQDDELYAKLAVEPGA